MKRSYQVFLGVAGAAGLALAGLPALAQTDGSTGGRGPAGVETPNATPGQIEVSPNQDQIAPGNRTEQNAVPGNVTPNMNPSTDGTGSASMGSMTLSEILRNSTSFSMLNSLVATAASNNEGFSAPFMESGNVTVLAPTDQAFAALPPGAVRMLVQPENRDLLVRILENHVVEGNNVSERAGSIGAAGSQISASNGTIIPINQVLIPADVASELQSRMALVQSVSPISLNGTSSPTQVAPGDVQMTPGGTQMAPGGLR